MSPNAEEIERLISPERLTSYMTETKSHPPSALELYYGNQEVSGAVFGDLSRLEVMLRNVAHQTLSAHAAQIGASGPRYTNSAFFPGRPGRRSVQNIADARNRATSGRRTEKEGRVIAELTFGFWRFLCVRPYLTTLWVPTLSSAFPNHPVGNAREVRSDVESRMDRLHFLRNRVAHHEPIHRRSIARDQAAIADLARWISADGHLWIHGRSSVTDVLSQRP